MAKTVYKITRFDGTSFRTTDKDYVAQVKKINKNAKEQIGVSKVASRKPQTARIRTDLWGFPQTARRRTNLWGF